MASLKKKPVVGHRKEDCASLSRENNILLRNIVQFRIWKGCDKYLELTLSIQHRSLFFFFCSTKARHPKEFVKFALKNFVNSLCEKCIKSILNFRCLCNKDLGFFYDKSRSRGSNEFCKLQL